MDGSNDKVKLCLTYEGGYVDAVIEENGVKRLYDGHFKNDSNIDPHQYCANVADEIERELGRDVLWSMKEIEQSDASPRQRRIAMENRYIGDFTLSANPYELALTHDKRINEQIIDASERVKAFPNDKSEHETLVRLYNEARVMWDVCENRLRKDADKTNDSNDRTRIAREINAAHNKVVEYKDKFKVALNNQLSNTSKLYQAGESMQQAGRSMQRAGDSMKSAGHSMTVGITIPIIIIVILFFLFMILF